MHEALQVLEVTEQTYYRWWKEYGGLDTTKARKLKELEKENSRLKHLVVDVSFDNATLKEVLSRNKASSEKRREAVEQSQRVFTVSERRICRVFE